MACQGQLDASKELAATRAQLDRISSSDGITRAPENEAFNHFRDEIQCLEDELFKARQHIRSLSHRRSASGGNDAPLQEAHQRIKEMEQEREDLLAGIAGLHKDIQRVRLDAVELGKEISSTQNGSGGSMRCAHITAPTILLTRMLQSFIIRSRSPYSAGFGPLPQGSRHKRECHARGFSLSENLFPAFAVAEDDHVGALFQCHTPHSSRRTFAGFKAFRLFSRSSTYLVLKL